MLQNEAGHGILWTMLYNCITGEDLSDVECALKVFSAAVDIFTLGSAVAAKWGIESTIKQNLKLIAKTITADIGSNVVAYSADYIGEQINLPTGLRILLSLTLGTVSAKYLTKYLVNADGTLKGYSSVLIENGKVYGKMDLKDYFEIRAMSIINKDSKTMTLGKFFKNEDGTMRADSYVAVAEKYHDTYFSLGNKWDEIKAKYHLTDDEMFEIFDKTALDDAVRAGKTFRFSQDPTLEEYRNSALDKEWIYLQQKYRYTDITKRGDYWYAIKGIK